MAVSFYLPTIRSADSLRDCLSGELQPLRLDGFTILAFSDGT
jgi:hypothetical protein